MKALVRVSATLLAITLCTAGAAPPAEVDYQGKVLVNDLPFTGSAYFKFAISDAEGLTNYWAQDGSANGEPAAHMTNEVFNGVFSTVLGATPMSSLNPAIFSLNTSLYLRVWFSTTTGGFAEMLPAQRLVSVPYALNAELLDGYHATGIVSAATNAVTLSGDVSGPVGNVQLQPNVVGTAELSNNSVNSVKIVDGTIGSIDIADGTVASVDIAADTIQAADIAADAVGSSELLDGGILDVDVGASAAIQGSKLQPGSLTNAGALRLATGSTGTQAIATGHPYLNAFGVVNTLTAAAPRSALTIAGVAPLYVSNQAPSSLVIGLAGLGLPNLDNVIWVATNGTAAGPGTMELPYDTPQNGYNAAMARFPSTPAALVIAAGSYGNLDLNAGNIHVVGLFRPELNRIRAAMPLASFMNSKVRVEGMVVTGQLSQIAFLNVTGVKFRNMKFLEGFWLLGHDIEMEHCYITQRTGVQFGALRLGDGGSLVSTVSLHNCSIEVSDGVAAALRVEANIHDLEVLWCEIVNRGGGPAITDAEPGPLSPVHLYAHNWIKGPPPTGAQTALNDWAVAQGPTIGFYHNTVFGNVGFANGGQPHTQFYANNAVHGRINWPGAGVVGWQQAGAGAGADAANNTEFQNEYPQLPDPWDD